MYENHSIHYYNPTTLLVVNASGKIRLLHTPFRVKCIDGIANIPANTFVHVEEVWSNEKDELQYMVFGELLSYKFFRLQLSF